MTRTINRRVFGGAAAATAITSAFPSPLSAKIQDIAVSENKNADVVRGLIKNFFNSHDPSAARDNLTEAFIFHAGSLGTIQGLDAYMKALAGFFRALPDVRATEQDVVQSEDKVCARFVVEGTHKGELWRIPATGRLVRWDAIMIYRFEGEKIAEQWANEDWTAVLRDVGYFSPPFAK